MKESRIKELMESVGMPDSQSLFIALQQTANEVEQEVRAEELACPKCGHAVGCLAPMCDFKSRVVV